MAWAVPASAGAKLPVAGGAELDLGLTLQTHTLLAHEDQEGDGEREIGSRFLVRRARLRLGAKLNRWASAQLQTDRGDGDARLGFDYRLIDAYLTLGAWPALRLMGGMHLPPSSRQNITVSWALMTFDRPGIAFKSLTWGTRAMGQFGNRALGVTDAGLRSGSPVRDLGWTAFGLVDLAPSLHLKYYAGVYEGVQRAGRRAPRLLGRVQLNLFDPEPAYLLQSTYLGQRRTVALGATYDAQTAVARDARLGAVDYGFFTADLFAEQPLGPGSLTVEAAYTRLSLGGARALDGDGNAETPARDARRSEGQGFYAQAGFFAGRVQPWLGYEQWHALDDAGNFRAARVGVTLFADGQSANLKLAYEHLHARSPLGAGGERSWGALALGAFLYL